MNAQRTQRYAFRNKVYFGANGEVYAGCSGEMGLKVARVFGPGREQTGQMLHELRSQCEWSEAALAAALGAAKNTVRKWLDGSRNPSGAATKLIWLLHATFVRQEPPVDLYDLISWGNASKEAVVLDDSARGPGAY